jgi:meiotically up-regulated gene 157 (Mug157) protein
MEKIFTTAYLRELDDLFARDKISYSRMVEILNEKANAAVAAEKQRWVEKIQKAIDAYGESINPIDGDKTVALEELLEGEKQWK